MGGSGGGEAYPPEKLDRLRQQSIDQLREQELDSEVNRFLGEQLAGTARDVELIRARLDDLLDALGDVVDGRVALLFGGSVAKHTYVDGLSDVDTLAVVDPQFISGDLPVDVARSFADSIREKATGDIAEVTPGRLSVTVLYRDGLHVDLLPAMRRGDDLLIASPDGRAWSRIRPDRFASKLSKVNEELAGRLVPTIKLAKSIIGQFPETRQISGYHTESLAIEAFRDYVGRRTPKDMLTHFFEKASERVMSPIADATGQSLHVDDELGESGSLERRLVSDSLARTGRRLRNATSLRQWEALFIDQE
jgi:hypothetical protein